MTGMSDFVERRNVAWDELNTILLRAGARHNIRQLSREDLKKVGPLYRRAAADLAYVRLRGGDTSLILYLNDLVTRAHGLLYTERTPSGLRLWNFVASGFPSLLWKHLGLIGIAAAVFVLGGLLSAWLCWQDRNLIETFVPHIIEHPTFYKDLSERITDSERPQEAAFLMQNNIRVSFMAFAVGILAAIPTLLILFVNGLPIGALAVHQHDNGLSTVFWAFICPHGVPELSAIFISGAAGMLLGKALISPGEYSRKDALALAGQDAIRLVAGTVLMLILAGFIEAFISPAALPPAFKFAFATLLAVGLFAYIRSGRKQGLPQTTPERGYARP